MKHQIQIGDIYFFGHDDLHLVLTQCDADKVAFVCLTNFTNRWRKSVLVKDVRNISQKEFEEICGIYKTSAFEYIGRLEDIMRIHTC